MFSSLQIPDRLSRHSRRWRWASILLSCTLSAVTFGQEIAPQDAPDNGVTFPSVDPAVEPLPGPVTEAASGSLTLADLERLALENNPTLPMAAANVTAARGRRIQAWLYPNPVIGYSGEEMGDDGTAGMQGGFVSQEFITAGKRRLDRAIFGQEVQESQWMFQAQELRVLSDVRLRFYDALVAQREVELTGQLVDISDRFADLSGQLLRAQQVSQNDLLQAEIEAEEARILFHNARNQSAEAWRRLVVTVGLPAMEETTLAGQLEAAIPSYDWEETFTRVLGGNPELAAAQARIRRARFVIERERREPIPNIDVMAQAMHMNTSGSDAASVLVGIPIPVFNRNQGNRLQAEAEQIAAQNGSGRIELELRDRLAMVYRRYANARQQVDRYKNEILPRAQQSIDLVSRGYGAGQVDFLTLLISQRTYIRVNLMYLESLAELWQASMLIEGQLLSDSLVSETVTSGPLK